MENGTNGNKKGNGTWIVIGLCHIARNCVYYPAKDADPKHGHAQTSGLVNTPDGREVPATLNFWGKYADIACCNLETGSRIFLVGEMTTYNQDTGLKDAGGKKVMRRLTEVRVNHMQFAGATKKQIASRIRKNWAALMNVGRIPATLPLTDELLEALLKVDSVPTTTFNMANALATGLHGNAKVMVNKQYIGPQAAAGAGSAVVTGVGAMSAQLAEMQRMLDEFKKLGVAVPGTVNAVVEPEVVEEVPADVQSVEAVDAFAGVSVV